MDYPKMLYLSGLASFAIAHDEDEEAKMIKDGYITHDEAVKLEDEQPKVGTREDFDKELKDHLDDAYKHIEQMEAAIETKDGIIKDLQAKYEELNSKHTKANEWIDEITNQYDLARNQVKDLQAKLATYEQSDNQDDGKAPSTTDYDAMTADELRSLLDARDVEYKSRDSKADLVKLAQDSE